MVPGLELDTRPKQTWLRLAFVDPRLAERSSEAGLAHAGETLLGVGDVEEARPVVLTEVHFTFIDSFLAVKTFVVRRAETFVAIPKTRACASILTLFKETPIYERTTTTVEPILAEAHERRAIDCASGIVHAVAEEAGVILLTLSAHVLWGARTGVVLVAIVRITHPAIVARIGSADRLVLTLLADVLI